MKSCTIAFCCCVFLGDFLLLGYEAKSIVGPERMSHGTNLDHRIMDGEDATLGQFPWYALLVSTKICGGVVISEEWMLTAAKCVDSGDFAIVQLGVANFSETEREIVVNSSEIIVHEKYDASTLSNNIALIKFSEKLQFNDVIAPIALSSEPLEGGEEVTVTGFGATSDYDVIWPSTILQYMNVTTITNSECSEIYGDAVLDEVVCTSAGSPVKSVCYFDIGDPAVLYTDGDPLLVGIVSFFSKRGCGGDPSAYTRISVYRDWIKDVTGV